MPPPYRKGAGAEFIPRLPGPIRPSAASRREISVRSRERLCLSVRGKLVIAAVVPLVTCVASILLAAYFVVESQFDSRARTKLETVSTFVVEASQLGLMTKSASQLEQAVASALAYPDIVQVAIFGTSGPAILSEGLAPARGLPDFEQLLVSGPRYDRSDPSIRVLEVPVLMARGETEPELIARTHALSLGSEVATQDVAFVYVRLFSNPAAREESWRFLQSRWAKLRRRIAPLLVSRVIAATPALGTPAYRREVSRFFRENPVPAGERTLRQALERFDAETRFRRSAGPALEKLLANLE